MDNSFKNIATKGIKWSIIDNIANSGITFLVGLILARILTPSEFGIIGIITVFIAIGQTFIDGGFSNALIRKIDVNDKDYNTVFYSSIIISLFIMIVLWLLSKQIAVFFDLPILEDITPVMSLILIIGSFSIVQRTDLIIKIDFKTQAKISLISSIGSGMIGVSLALLEFGVWSLVVQQISRQVLVTLFLWLLDKWKPAFLFSSKSFKELFGFASKILISNLINSFFKNGFTFIIGKFYFAEQLGQYSRADQFNTIATNNLVGVIQKVSFPALSSIQDDRERLIRNFKRILIYSSIITFPLVLGIGAIAKPLIIFLIGEKWIDAVLYLQIMCVYGILYPMTAINLNMLNIEGRSDLILKMEFIKKILFIPLFFIAYNFSMITLLISVTIYYYIEFIFNSYYSKRFFGYGTWQQIKDVMPILIISFSVSSILWSFSLLSLPNLLILTLQAIVFCILYPLLFKISRINEFNELTEIAKEQIKKTHF